MILGKTRFNSNNEDMMKRLIEYFKKKRDARIKRFCIKESAKSCNSGEELTFTAKWIYDWIKSK